MPIGKSLQELIWQRADSRCEYCQVPQNRDTLPFEIDHIIAFQHGGPTIEDNLALACFACNHHKGPNIAGIDSTTTETVPLFHPRHDIWRENFQWNGPILEGLTAVGRVTIHVLAIDRDYRVSFRRTLILEGVLPGR
jgi:hypothetical protein